MIFSDMILVVRMTSFLFLFLRIMAICRSIAACSILLASSLVFLRFFIQGKLRYEIIFANFLIIHVLVRTNVFIFINDNFLHDLSYTCTCQLHVKIKRRFYFYSCSLLIAFCKRPMYLEHFSASTFSLQNVSMPSMSSSFVFNLSWFPRKRFSSRQSNSIELRSGDSGGVFHQYIPLSS